ncbi:site-specific integrase [Salinimicrobium catena]|uniref:site-specific integrase n=1 Tax=Salinimicrobium catena TaxID=390640 RepID=UPI001FE12294|nr:site-specific integrase [Salinimicrobium catena]
MKKERGFLTEKEITAIERLRFPTERLEVVRDLFIFSCYTGISFGDIMLLSAENLMSGEDGNDWIITKRKKTLNPVKIPLLSKAQRIILKYRDSPRTVVYDSLLPRISNQKANAYLKEIQAQAKINKKLTFHLARHTFATTITLSNGVPLETISKLLGHSELRTTQIYAKVVEKKVSEDMMKLRQKIDREPEPEIEEEFNSNGVDFCYHYREK